LIPALLAITPGDDRELIPWLDALAIAGVSGVLLREPHRTVEQVLALVEHAQRRFRCVALHTKNTEWSSIAAEYPALVVHRSSRDENAHPIPNRWGVSCHDRGALDRAFANGAAYAFLSPVWAPTSKPDDARSALGLETFLDWSDSRRVWALGGVTPERHRELVRRGAAGSAVLGALFGGANPAHATAAAKDFLS
jgi:thiamine monophosphate synthase